MPNLVIDFPGNAIIGLLTEKSPNRLNIKPTMFQGDVRILYEPIDFMTLAHSLGGIVRIQALLLLGSYRLRQKGA